LQDVVLLSGTLCDAQLWAHQIEALTDIAQCWVPDISQHPTLRGIAQYILEQAPPQFALAGLSFGGIVAFELWRQAPHRITRIALLHTTPYPVSYERRQSMQTFLDMGERGEFRNITTDYLKDAMLHPNHQTDKALRQQILAMAERIGMTGFRNQVQAQLNRPDSTVDLETISIPTLVLTGQEDRVCPPEIHEFMASKIRNSRLNILLHCGHLSTLERPQVMASIVRDWLQW